MARLEARVKDGCYLPSQGEREYLRRHVSRRPDIFRAQIERTGGTPRQQAKRRYIRRLLWHHRRDKMIEWYGPTGKDAPVTTRKMTDEEVERYFGQLEDRRRYSFSSMTAAERARYFPEGKW